MTRLRRFFPLLALTLALALSPSLSRADDYVRPDYVNLIKGLIRLGALNMADDAALDEYGALTECDLFVPFYNDDFKWQKVRQAIRKDIKDNVVTFPTGFYYDTKFQLDRYDFHDHQFHFLGNVETQAVNAFTLNDYNRLGCGGYMFKVLPIVFKLVLDKAVTFASLPLSESDARALLEQMEKEGNKARTVHARFNIRVLYADPLNHPIVNGHKQDLLAQREGRGVGTVFFDAHLDSVSYCADEACTHLLYTYQP